MKMQRGVHVVETKRLRDDMMLRSKRKTAGVILFKKALSKHVTLNLTREGFTAIKH